MSAICSKKCRSSPTCGPRGTPRQGGREPPWGRGASGTPPCGSTRKSAMALSFLCPREEWCVDSDRAIATAIRSWRRNERRRRSLRRRALPVPPPASSRSTSIINRWSFSRKRLQHGNAWVETPVVVVVVVVVVVRTFVLHEGVCPATRTLAPN